MSIFYCVGCDELRDADDGCDEAAPGSLDLICADCMEAREEAEELAPETPTPAVGTTRERLAALGSADASQSPGRTP